MYKYDCVCFMLIFRADDYVQACKDRKWNTVAQMVQNYQDLATLSTEPYGYTGLHFAAGPGTLSLSLSPSLS